jgi:hypothetical protein
MKAALAIVLLALAVVQAAGKVLLPAKFTSVVEVATLWALLQRQQMGNSSRWDLKCMSGWLSTVPQMVPQTP